MQSEQPPTDTWLKSACWHVSAQAGEFNPSVRDSDLWLYARMCSRVKGFDLALNGVAYTNVSGSKNHKD